MKNLRRKLDDLLKTKKIFYLTWKILGNFFIAIEIDINIIFSRHRGAAVFLFGQALRAWFLLQR